jgi:hypothetical protein
MIDNRLLNKGLNAAEEVAKYGLTEAHRRNLENEIDFYIEIGIMRTGDIEILSNGRRLDYRVGALPAMWELLVLNSNN